MNTKSKKLKPSEKKPLAKTECPIIKKYADGYESFSENLLEYDGNEEIRDAIIKYKKELSQS